MNSFRLNFIRYILAAFTNPDLKVYYVPQTESMGIESIRIALTLPSKHTKHI